MSLTSRQLERYADVLLWALAHARSGKFAKGDIVMIRHEPASTRLAEILYEKLLARGINPVPRAVPTPAMERGFFSHAGPSQLTFLPPGEKELYRRLNGSIFLHAPESLTHLAHVDPKKIGRTLVARKPLRAILERREETGDFGWTLCTSPTRELARQAHLSLAACTGQIVRACYLDSRDPVARWKSICRDASEIKGWLNGMKAVRYHIESKNTDLIITPGVKRKWIGISGHNIPSFELFLSPDWRGTEGRYFANQPSYRTGNYVEGVRLIFKKGSAVSVEAEKGQAFAQKQLAIDRGANKVGEFSLTDRRFSRIDCFMADTLFDENYGGRYGNCHIALGSSYSDTYDGNTANLTKERKEALGFNDSALHWDLVNTEEKTVTAHLASGKQAVIYQDGMFTC